MPPIIRDATPADLPRIVEIYNTAIPGRLATADTSPVTVAARQQWFSEHNPRTRPIWVLEEGSMIVAWAALSTFYGRPAYAKTAELSIYVAPDHQRKSYGKLLVQSLIARCPEFGITTLLGLVFAHNAPSLTLLTRLGFRTWGHLPGVAELDEQSRDLLIVGLKVSGGQNP